MSSEAAEKRLYVLAELDQRTQTEGIRLYSRLTAAGFSGRQTPGLPYHITLESFPCEEEGKVLSAVQKAAGGDRARFPYVQSYRGVRRRKRAVSRAGLYPGAASQTARI